MQQFRTGFDIFRHTLVMLSVINGFSLSAQIFSFPTFVKEK